MAKSKDKNLGGRPPKFETAEQLQKKINEYFKNCPDKKNIITKTGEVVEFPTPTICGLCYFLGFESRQSFYDYEKIEKFSYIIKRARLFVEKEYELLLQSNNCTGAIFALKNMGWVDKTQQELTGVNGEPLTVKKVYVTPEEMKKANKHIDEIINS